MLMRSVPLVGYEINTPRGYLGKRDVVDTIDAQRPTGRWPRSDRRPLSRFGDAAARRRSSSRGIAGGVLA
jgi:hypothetical protein